jgi:hypothetical protein
MSWDVLVLAAPSSYASMDDIPSDFTGQPFGPAAVVLQKLQTNFPGIDLQDPAWGVVTGPGWSIELNIGRDDPIDSIMLHVRGSGDGVLEVIADIAETVGGRALDVSEGVFLTREPEQLSGWHAF